MLFRIIALLITVFGECALAEMASEEFSGKLRQYLMEAYGESGKIPKGSSIFVQEVVSDRISFESIDLIIDDFKKKNPSVMYRGLHRAVQLLDFRPDEVFKSSRWSELVKTDAGKQFQNSLLILFKDLDLGISNDLLDENNPNPVRMARVSDVFLHQKLVHLHIWRISDDDIIGGHLAAVTIMDPLSSKFWLAATVHARD